MPIFAKIDSEGIVTETVNTTAYSILSGEYGDNEDWVQTYPNSEKRGVYATVGDIYLRTHDKFINPKPHPSWTLNSDGNWEAPVAYPSGASPRDYLWDESTTSWVINNSEG